MPKFKVILKHSFSILSVALICLSIYGFRTFTLPQMYDLSKNLGVLAVILFLLTIIPGITQRLRLTQLNSIVNPLRFSRRTLGVAMFFAALSHYFFAVVFKIIKTGKTPEIQTYFIFGFLALFLSFWLALTSSDFFKKVMGKWWKILHSSTYAVVWLIFLHTAFIEISPISILILIFALLQGYTLVKFYYLDKKKVLPS